MAWDDVWRRLGLLEDLAEQRGWLVAFEGVTIAGSTGDQRGGAQQAGQFWRLEPSAINNLCRSWFYPFEAETGRIENFFF
jgi:hypothetical protein